MSTQVKIRVEKAIPADAEGVAVLVSEKTKVVHATALVAQAERDALNRMLQAGMVQGKAREIVVDLIEAGQSGRRYLLVAGLGPAEKVTAESLRQAGGLLAKAAQKHRISSLAVLTPGASGVEPSGRQDESQAAAAIASGIVLGSFRYEEYKGAVSRKNQNQDTPGELEVSFVSRAEQAKSIGSAVERARIIAEAQNYARTIASRPGNNINPPSLAEVAEELADEVGLSVQVLDEKQMAKLGMGGILAVGGASAHPPRLIVLEYPQQKGKQKKPKSNHRATLLVVGKSITFDSGGISIKPAEKMGRMIYDKSGGMAVLGLMYALARLQLPVHVVGILSSAENTLSGQAYRPGDILRMYNGVTVEVTNTDAEGRLVLGDALAWGIETYKPAAVVDLATLTGGVVVALGKTMAGAMSNHDGLFSEIHGAADRSGEKIWRLPIWEEHREQIKSDPADIVNSAGREASPLQGAAFLSYFVPEGTPWLHLDIAGVSDIEKELPYYAKGATGWGVRTLVEWVSARAVDRGER